MSKKAGLYMLVIVFFFTVIVSAFALKKTELDYINEYFWSSGNEVLRIYTPSTNFGPFLIKLDNQRIYKVKTEDGTYWFRFGSSPEPEIEVDVAQIH